MIHSINPESTGWPWGPVNQYQGGNNGPPRYQSSNIPQVNRPVLRGQGGRGGIYQQDHGANNANDKQCYCCYGSLNYYHWIRHWRSPSLRSRVILGAVTQMALSSGDPGSLDISAVCLDYPDQE